MSRLVDVDELIKYFAEDLEGYDNREYILQTLDVKGRIERVEAIPIEWLKEWFNTKMNSTLLPRNFEMVCGWMIYDWEKENEK